MKLLSPLCRMSKHPQGSEGWFKDRHLKFTGSEIYSLINERSDTLSAGAHTYIIKKIERAAYDSIYFDDIITPDMERGKEKEPDALSTYELITGVDLIDSCNFFTYNDYFGTSPDGLSTDFKRSQEVKCGNTTAHIRYLLLKTPEDLKKVTGVGKKYFYQCHSHNLGTGSEVCDFITFDDREYKNVDTLGILEIPYNKEINERILFFAELANERMQNLLIDLKLK